MLTLIELWHSATEKQSQQFHYSQFEIKRLGVIVLDSECCTVATRSSGNIPECNLRAEVICPKRVLNGLLVHYSDVIISAMVSQITGVSMVFSTVCSGADKRKHQSSASLPLWKEFTGDRWIPLTVTRKKVSIWWRHHVLLSTSRLVACLIKYSHGFIELCFGVVVLSTYYVSIYKSFRVASLALGYLWHCPSDSEVILMDKGKIDQCQTSIQYSKYRILWIFLDDLDIDLLVRGIVTVIERIWYVIIF